MWYKRLSMILFDLGKRYHWTHDKTGKNLVLHTKESLEKCRRVHYNQRGEREPA